MPARAVLKYRTSNRQIPQRVYSLTQSVASTSVLPTDHIGRHLAPTHLLHSGRKDRLST